jgi:cell fate (sporulation/competence/biofilm development) regulator YmcA (YheA/YmcA/DUF963 family)
MKILKFISIAERTFEVQFREDDFFDWMKVHGCPNLKIQKQVCLYLNIKHQQLLSIQGESANSIKYRFSQDFRKKYSDINDLLEYDL